MNGLKIAAIVALALILVFLGSRIYAFVVQENTLSATLDDVKSRLTKAQADEASLEAQTQYLANPANLEKELRARFNYKKPGETMIVIVPGATTTATGTEE